MAMSHSLETSRYSGDTAKTGSLTVTGLNTGTVSLTGQWEAQRTATSGTAIALETSFDHSLDLTEIVITSYSIHYTKLYEALCSRSAKFAIG